ncbi:ciliary BBSome complex subunit 1-domain-containing protein [Chytridium lagenaria]|nr:ciliary BBSome complex subunit 1-domain-containing protein [Chytridium lagenaria]
MDSNNTPTPPNATRKPSRGLAGMFSRLRFQPSTTSSTSTLPSQPHPLATSPHTAIHPSPHFPPPSSPPPITTTLDDSENGHMDEPIEHETREPRKVDGGGLVGDDITTSFGSLITTTPRSSINEPSTHPNPSQLLETHLQADLHLTQSRHAAFWLDALNAPLAGIHTFSSCMDLVDVEGGGEFELVVADVGEPPKWLMNAIMRDDGKKKVKTDPVKTGMGDAETSWLEFKTKLRCYRGNRVISESILPVPPTSLTSFHPDSTSTMLALSSGPSIYMYRHRHPFFKFTLPMVHPDPLESEVWMNLGAAVGATPKGVDVDEVVVESAFFRLAQLREEANVGLTRRSERLLGAGVGERGRMVMEVAGEVLMIEPVITCMTSMPRSHAPNNLTDCLVLGSEERLVYIISPPNYSIIEKFQLSSPIVFLSTWGVYEDGLYRISASCRDNHIYMIAPNVCYRIVQLEVPACGLMLFEKNLVVACMNNNVYSYHLKGRLLFVKTMPSPIVATSEAKFPEKQFHGYLIPSSTQPAVSMKFGTFGREPGALVLVQRDGTLTVKMLKRQVNLGEVGEVVGPVREQEVPIPVPRKTKLFVEQMSREKQKPGEIFRDFERDFGRLKRYADVAFEKIGEGIVKPDIGIQLNLELFGLGPEFHLILTCKNITPTPSLISSPPSPPTQPSITSIIPYGCDRAESGGETMDEDAGFGEEAVEVPVPGVLLID